MSYMQDDSLYRYGRSMTYRELVELTAPQQKPKRKIKKESKMTNAKDREAFVKRFHDVDFGAAIFACTKVQNGLARVFTRAEKKAFNRIVNRDSKNDTEDLLVAYRLIGGKVAAESRKKLTFLLFGEVKNETKNGRMVHCIEHRTDKEMKAAKADKKDLMSRIKLLSESFTYIAKTTDKVEDMIKAYEKLSEKDQKYFLRKLYELY